MKSLIFCIFFSGTLLADMVAESVLDSLIKKDRWAMSYKIYCASCHGADGASIKGYELGRKELGRYKTVSEIFLYLKRSHHDKIENFSRIKNIDLIYSSRFVKYRLP